MPIIKKKPPTSDWNCREIQDAKMVDRNGSANCEFCGTRIRWIHILEHDEHHKSMQAGCCCAERLCFGYDASTAENEFKNRMARLHRFMNLKRWKRSQKNPQNIVRNINTPKWGKILLTIYLWDGQYGITIKEESETYFHPVKYVTQPEALAVAFDLVETVKGQSIDEP